VDLKARLDDGPSHGATLAVVGYKRDETVPERITEAESAPFKIVVCGTEADLVAARTTFGDRADACVIDASSDIAGVVGDLFGEIRMRQLKKPVLGTPLVESGLLESAVAGPVITIAGGTSELREALRTASDLAGITCYRAAEGEGVLPLDDRRGPSASGVFAALRSTFAGESKIMQRAYPTLVSEATGTRRATRLLFALLADDAVMLARDHKSACADLLERAGYPEEAEELRRLVSHWVRQRNQIWYPNYVPEMVLHDDAHSVAVDRNVASLCEPLLDAGRVDLEDVFTLALAAWLHDWGHASARYRQVLATDPVDVRSFHGALSATRLRQSGSRVHGVGDRLANRIDIDRLAGRVALISEHHQGWTSCNADKSPKEKEPEQPERLRVKPSNDPADGGLDGPLIRAFDLDFFALEKGRREPPDDKDQRDRLERAHRQLALLRLADALDVGIHRAPDYETRSVGERALLETYWDRLEERFELVKGRSRLPLFDVDPVAVLKQAFIDVAGARNQILDPSGKTIALALEERLPGFENGRPTARSDLSVTRERLARDLQKEMSRAVKYVEHVLKQEFYYDEQISLRALLPVPVRSPQGSFRLGLRVVPNPSVPKDREKQARLRQTVQSFAMREWGQEVKRAGRDPEPAENHKRPIRDYLGAIGFSIDPGLLDPTGIDGIELLKDLPVTFLDLSEAPAEPTRSAGPGAGAEGPASVDTVSPVAAYPDGLGKWFDADHLASDSAVPDPSDAQAIASDIDGIRLATIDGDHLVRTTHGGRTQSESLLPKLPTDARVLCLDQSDQELRMVVAAGPKLVGYRWDDGWKEDRIILSHGTGQVARAFVWPDDAAGRPLILVTREGNVYQDNLADTPQVGPHVREVQSIDAIRRDGAIWVAYVELGRNQIKVWCSTHNSVIGNWTPPRSDVKPVDVLWARRYGHSALALAIKTDSAEDPEDTWIVSTKGPRS
jgi:hypothetical protein